MQNDKTATIRKSKQKKIVKTFLCIKLKYEFYDNVMNEGFRFLNSSFLRTCFFIRFNIKPLYSLCKMMIGHDVVEL